MSTSLPPTVVVLDAYSSGARLPALFAQAGWRVIHVQSRPDIPKYFFKSFPGAEAFASCITHDGDPARTARALASFAPRALVCGAETGAGTQDALAYALGLAGNDPLTTLGRTDKFQMHATLARAGMAHARQILTDSPEEATKFAETETGWPVVLKPLDSAGGDGVTVCHDRSEIDAAMGDLVGGMNALGRRIQRLAVQEYLHGQEYVVNATARCGHRVISEIWRIHKTVTGAGHSIYDFGELLDGAGSEQATLSCYAMDVAEALGIDEGAIHVEIMLTERGPVLIEIAVRLAGGISHATTQRALGHSHASVLMLSITDPERFSVLPQSGYRRDHAAVFVSLINWTSGVVRSTPGRSHLESLPSFVEAIGLAAEGDQIAPTENLFSGGGLVYLCHRDPAQLLRDRAAIRSFEECGFYQTDFVTPVEAQRG